MQQRVQFCTTSDGVQIAFAVLGQGHPLVLVPGWVSHLELEMEVPDAEARLSQLMQHFTLVRYDKRGTGLSDRNVTDFGVEARLLDLEAVIDRLGFTRYALRGISEGGPVAIAHAVRHADRVSHLILQGTFAHFGRSDTGDALINLIAAEWGLGSATMTSIFMPNATKEQQEFYVRYQREAASREGAAAMLLANIETDVRELLPQVKAPTLVIHSESDRAVPFEHARQLTAHIPDARLMRYKGDHAALLAFAEINSAIIEFAAGEATAGEAGTGAQAGMLTVMFTDIEASTTITQKLGDAGAQEVLHRHNDIIRGALRENGGAEIKHTGDGIMASFGTASAALACAAAVSERSPSTTTPRRSRASGCASA